MAGTGFQVGTGGASGTQSQPDTIPALSTVYSTHTQTVATTCMYSCSNEATSNVQDQ